MTVSETGITPNVEHIEQFCLALESGRYQQARGVLKNEIGNCCLGVACNVKDPARWHKREGKSIFTYLEDSVDEMTCSDVDEAEEIVIGAIVYLTYDVATWYGFSGVNPIVSVQCRCTKDSEGELGQTTSDPLCDDCDGTGKTNMLLTELNDEWRLNFKQIAKALRDTYLTSTSSEGGNDA